MSKQVQAIAKGVSQSPRKVSEVAALVRGRTVADALVILEHVQRRAATPVRKAIESAKANATYNHNVKEDTLKLIEVNVTSGPRIKRYRPAAHGRALPFQRKTSHIKIVVEGQERPAKKPAKTAETKESKESK
jgi:large subunit ribosomal protein L22